MKSKLLLVPAFLTMFLALPARANDYSFDFLSGTYDVSGTFTTANAINGVGGHDIVGISGSVTGGVGAITSLEVNPAAPFPTVNFGFIYDNVLFPTAPYLNSNGVLFNAGGNRWNLWANSSTDYELYSYSGVDVHGIMTVAAVPEPETYAMMLAGLGLMGFVIRRRKQKQSAA